MFRQIALATAAVALVILAGPVGAEDAAKTDEKPPAKVAPAKATPKQIAQWVKDLGADKYDTREEAVKKLAAAGKPVIAPVAKAAKGKALEVSTRAVAVLKKLLASEDAETKAAARAALEELSKDEEHPSSHMAWEALNEGKGDGKGGGINIGGGRIIFNNAGGGIRVVAGNNGQAVRQMVQAGIGGQFKVVTVTNNNGNKETDVVDNGKTVKIVEGKEGITVTVGDANKKDAKPKEYKAADAKELKTKHPEAHKLYEKYGKGDAGVGNININIADALRGRQPRMPRVPKDIRKHWGRFFAENGKQIDEANKDLDKALAALKAATKARKEGEADLDLAELIKQIESARKKLTEARKGLGD